MEEGETLSTKRTNAQIERDSINYLAKLGYEIIKPDTMRCLACQKHRSTKQPNFYKTNSRLYDGTLPVCKSCLEKFYTQYLVNTSNNEKLSMYLLCQELNAVWMEQAWDSATREKNTTWKVYMKNVNSLKQYSNLSFKDSDEYVGEVEITDENTGDIKKVKLSKSKLSELQEKYGYGFTNEEYLNFERKYKKMSVGYKEKTSLHTERFITYIIHKVKEEMATIKGDVGEAEKWSRMAVKDAETAKLNVSQLSKNDITGGIDLVPQLVEAIEDKLSLIPVMPKLKAIPYDDIDMNIYALVNYYRRLEDKPAVEYKDVWGFYDNFVNEHFSDQGYSEEEIDRIKSERNAIFKDLGERYVEPLYFDHHDSSGDEDE